MNAIAIDFGSNNTVIARWNIATNQAETLNFESLNRPTPYKCSRPITVICAECSNRNC